MHRLLLQSFLYRQRVHISRFKTVLLAGVALLLAGADRAQTKWPRSIRSGGGDLIQVYQPQPETFRDDHLKAKSAVSVVRKGASNRVFGAVWFYATMETNRSTRMVTLKKIKVIDARLSGTSSPGSVAALKRLLETEIPKCNLTISLDQLHAPLKGQNETRSSYRLSTVPPGTSLLYATNTNNDIFMRGHNNGRCRDEEDSPLSRYSLYRHQ